MVINERQDAKEQTNVTQWSDGGCPPQTWMRQAPAPRYRRLAQSSSDASPVGMLPALPHQAELEHVGDDAEVIPEQMASEVEVIASAPSSSCIQTLAPSKPIVVQPVSFEAVLNSKRKIITRFERAKEAYNSELSQHNSVMREAQKAFDEGDMEQAEKIIITIYHSCVSLNQSNINMKHALREALMAKTDMMNVHTKEKLPEAFETFFQSVKNLNTLTAEVDFYLQRIRQAAATSHDVAEKVWYQLGERLIDVSNKLG